MMRAAVLGVGRMGRRHLRVVARAGLELAGAADPLPEARATAAAELGLPTGVFYEDPEGLLSATRPEVVIIATTAPSHHALTIAAAERGARIVICEKPMASSLEQCDEMIAACDRSGAKLFINHPTRHVGQMQALRDVVSTSDFGGLRSITVVGGNQGIAMNGVHYFELLRWLTGEDIDVASAWFDQVPVVSPRGAEFSDRAGQVRLSTKSGVRLHLELGADQGHGARIIAAGRTGIASLDELTGRIEVSTRQPAHRDAPTTRYAMPAADRTLETPAAEPTEPSYRVLRAAMDGGDAPSAENGRAAVAALVACYVSSESDAKAVRVDPNELPRRRLFDYA